MIRLTESFNKAIESFSVANRISSGENGLFGVIRLTELFSKANESIGKATKSFSVADRVSKSFTEKFAQPIFCFLLIVSD